MKQELLMATMKKYSLESIRELLKKRAFPLEGITRLGSARFSFREPAGTVGVALHAGSNVRPDMRELMAVSREERFLEEDPYTDRFVKDFPVQLVAMDSRFEYDLNREMEEAIYPFSEKKWGLQVWKRPLTTEETENTLIKYREFHELLEMVIDHILGYHKTAILFDVHSFCYQREQRKIWWKDERPEINLGTRSIDRKYFAPLVDLFLEQLARTSLDGHKIRVAENEIFSGGYLTRKFAASHQRRVLVLAIEYKKIFMDEHTGKLDEEILDRLAGDLLLAKDRLR
jgi:N-formylglutamate amidohydrolase